MSKQQQLHSKEFDTRKEQVISSLVEFVDPERRDKSPKGFIDEPILDLMHVINQHPSYYTTSSCSGRVAIYCEGLEKDIDNSETDLNLIEKTTKGGTWLYVSHDPIAIPQTDNQWIVDLLFGKEKDRVVFDNKRPMDVLDCQLIYFKFEPLILHIEASSQETAMHLLGVAYQTGYQNSGMTPSRRHMMAIRSTLKIDTPIAYIGQDKKIHCLVDPAYMFLLLAMSNQKFEQNMERMKVFEETMKKELTRAEEKENWESKEKRRERKRLEGIAKKDALVKEKKEENDTSIVEDLLENVTL